MIFWVLLGIYVIGWAGFSVTIARFLNADTFASAENALDAAMLVGAAMMIAIFWPLVTPGGWVYKKVFGQKEQ